MEFKDYFSLQASDYAKFRPDYPLALYDCILANTHNRQLAWDCATGNGQVAIELVNYFDNVIATDASAGQLTAAYAHDKIDYQLAPAEQSGLINHSVDLITVGQALHWFEFDAFYAEVARVAKPNATIAVFSYGIHYINPAIDAIVKHYYDGIVGPYWPKERKYIDDGYVNIPFPYDKIMVPELTMQKHWDFRSLMGYLFTWSATQQYIKAHGNNPLEQIATELKQAWGDEQLEKTVTWPLVLLLGKVNSE